MSTATPTEYTADDLLTIPDGDLYEVVNGQLVERKMSVTSSWVAGEVHRLLANHVLEHRLGWAFPEGTSYQCFPWDPGRGRRADASFIASGRFENDELPDQGHIRIVPDLVVEVVSPQDTYYEVDQKVEDYLQAGVRLVWVINPEKRIVRIHRAVDGNVLTLHEGDELSGEDVLQGFRCRVAELLPRKVESAGWCRPATWRASLRVAAKRGSAMIAGCRRLRCIICRRRIACIASARAYWHR